MKATYFGALALGSGIIFEVFSSALYRFFCSFSHICHADYGADYADYEQRWQ